MPGLIRKFLIFAAVDGVFLQLAGQDNRSGLLFTYGNPSKIKAISRVEGCEDGTGLEAYGIVGILNLVSRSYLISITRKSEVAQIQGKRIFEIKDVILVPLTTQSEAQLTLTSRSRPPADSSSKHPHEDEVASQSDEDYDSDASVQSNKPTEAAALETPSPKEISRQASVLKGVVQDKGKYGRFAERWFSKGGWNVAQRRRLGMTESEMGKELENWNTEKSDSHSSSATAETITQQGGTVAGAATASEPSSIQLLTPRIVRAARLYFSSGGFYFSYEHDLSKTLAASTGQSSQPALYRSFQSQYLWNEHLLRPIAETGRDEYLLPILQGFVGQRAFSLRRSHDGNKLQDESNENSKEQQASSAGKETLTEDKQEFLLTLISRRSIHRAGLRYLRRGVDDEGHVANSVETEQILAPAVLDSTTSTYSLVQIRGSIPLFFSQSPYSLKPIPHQFRSEKANQAAFHRHFRSLQTRYGDIQAVSLVDKHGTEANIGQSYEKYAISMNETNDNKSVEIGFEWFDFHSVCKGMNFGKVQLLLDTLHQSLTQFGYAAQVDGKLTHRQSGVLRTNCMDCLDRTNVVQSAVGGWALQQQLAELGMVIDLKNDPGTQWFNTLWADNGDNVSKQYAGTAALKGDFTRTRQRRWTGALSDFSLTLTRYYNNIFGDYFLQTCIDYYLGNTTPASFEEFTSDMITQDFTLDVSSIRQKAIDTSVKIVLESPNETFVAGHILACPHENNTFRTLPFEECVLLLTDAALYQVRFDWDAEKVSSFERVDLQEIGEIWHGAYITSTLAASHTDEKRNYGFAIRYKAKAGIVRSNTRSLANEQIDGSREKSVIATKIISSEPKSDQRALAFKALPPRSSISNQKGKEVSEQRSEVDMIKHICSEISSLIETASCSSSNSSTGDAENTDETSSSNKPVVWQRDVVSVAEAKKSTGYVESLTYSLKKLVWS